jgi:uncharacterized membrane protein (UPF0127 family)
VSLIGCAASDQSSSLQTVTFNHGTLQVEIASTPQERAQGLMFRKELAQDQGMLFCFEKSGIHNFWMKNTSLPLSIAFLDETGKILKVEDMAPLDMTHLHPSPPGTRYAIEVNQGWFKRKGVKVGDAVDLRLNSK